MLQRCVRVGSRSATEARCCSPTAAARRWKDVPEERMWQQEVLILPLQPTASQATPCKKSGRKSTPAAEEIHRKSAEEILCVSTGNPYKVSLANLPVILRHHHAQQIIQDNLSLERMSAQILLIAKNCKAFPFPHLQMQLNQNPQLECNSSLFFLSSCNMSFYKRSCCYSRTSILNGERRK